MKQNLSRLRSLSGSVESLWGTFRNNEEVEQIVDDIFISIVTQIIENENYSEELSINPLHVMSIKVNSYALIQDFLTYTFENLSNDDYFYLMCLLVSSGNIIVDINMKNVLEIALEMGNTSRMTLVWEDFYL